MRNKIVVGGALATLAALAAVWVVSTRAPDRAPGSLHVALVGASIGQDWQLAGWPARVHASDLSAESIAAWQFDKTDALDELLMRPKRKFRLTRSGVKALFSPPPPKADVVILKECSSYFPGDAQAQRAAFRAWEEKTSATGAKVVLATVVPVTVARSLKDAGKQQALSEFNAWVREYAAQKNLPVLDLDAALRAGAAGTNLKDEYTSGDGSHLNAAAYAVLDRTLLDTVCGLEADAACARVASR
ncbi:MAG TPA: GDSL-type esterase/lipase family protein [Steroidobacteraceae bacterium]|nr:GDSL-type esterase/lipase family protein [Steroidobacteraceae bacterium]